MHSSTLRYHSLAKAYKLMMAICEQIWDLRQTEPVMEFEHHTDFISCLGKSADSRHLLATSGDGTLSAIHLKRGRLDGHSVTMDDELLSLALVHVRSRSGWCLHTGSSREITRRVGNMSCVGRRMEC
jgi:WD40 repeat protein